MVDAVEHVLRAAVPELTMVEDRVDDRRRVARLDPPGVQACDAEAVGIQAVGQVMHALRGDCIIAICSGIQIAANTWNREPAQRKVGWKQLGIRPAARRIGEVSHRRVLQPGTHLVFRARIRTCAEVTARARLDAVAAHLHVPEQRLAQSERRDRILDEVTEVGRTRHRHGAKIARKTRQIG